ncbi:hypothetical protein J2T13_002107 [Paenibacillus sp. DS2015]|uniref:DUF3048 domain-containing protein n=1 Tax=Paenibacillus sp. DS2015 TaxID=3373917 RepID=UPI003D1AC6EF
MNPPKFSRLMGGMLALLLLSSCNNDDTQKAEIVTPVDVPTITEEQTPEPLEVASLLYTAPLTGLPVELVSTLRPIAVMVNNAPQARPQSGLTQADIVYEVLAEGGVTRFVAIYQSHNEVVTVGPVRSIRPYLIELGESYNGLLVHAGGSQAAYSIIQKQGKEDLDEIGNAGASFWRDKSRKAPHNLYTDVEKLRAGADKLKYKTEVTIPSYPFRTNDELISGENANKIDISFLLKGYKVSYQYDTASQMYKRSINDSPHIDLNNNEQLQAANVIVMGADHKVLDDVGRLSVDLESGGEAMLFQRGVMIKGNWIHKADDVIRFVKDGIEVPFVPGTTYINIVPNEPTFDSHVTVTNAE